MERLRIIFENFLLQDRKIINKSLNAKETHLLCLHRER